MNTGVTVAYCQRFQKQNISNVHVKLYFMSNVLITSLFIGQCFIYLFNKSTETINCLLSARLHIYQSVCNAAKGKLI